VTARPTGPPTERLGRQQRRDCTARALRSLATASSAKRRQDLLEYIVEINMPVAHSVATRFFNRGIDEDDLVQVAYAALTRAARDFDPGRHEDFLSYAVPTIRGEVQRHFRDCGWTVRPPRRLQDLQWRLHRAVDELSQDLGREPSTTELTEFLDIDQGELQEAMAAYGSFAPTSLDQPVGTSETTSRGDLIPDEDREQSASEARLTLAPVVRVLPERDRRILYLRFCEDRTQEEIGEELGVTQMQVSRLLTRIFRDIRDRLDDGELVAAG
jgi:RNA polymerase sigma-B factor